MSHKAKTKANRNANATITTSKKANATAITGKKTSKKPPRPLKLLALILGALLTFQVIFFFVALFEELTPYHPSSQHLLYTLEDCDYNYLRTLLGYYSEDELAQFDTLSECYAVRLYFESSLYYHVYSDIGDTQTAAYYLTASQEYAANMGELSGYVTKIDKTFANEQ